MTEPGGLFVSNIPPTATKTDIHLSFIRLTEGHYNIGYIVYPLENDTSRAFIKFSEFPGLNIIIFVTALTVHCLFLSSCLVLLNSCKVCIKLQLRLGFSMLAQLV